MSRPLQDAKNRLSEVVNRARNEGAHTVTVRGEGEAIVLSPKNYDAVTANRPTVVDRMLAGPPWDGDLAEAVEVRAKTPSRPPEV